MYECFVGYKGYKVEILNYLVGEEVGVKFVILCIFGLYVYGNLKFECGVYRLVCILLFDFNKRRYIFFVLCDVVFEIDEISEVELKDDDICMDIF